MSGFTVSETPKIKFTWKMHAVVANFLCKLIDMAAFTHLQERLAEENVKQATGNWQPGTRATKKIVDWCQDQWRRKEMSFPTVSHAYAVNEPSTMPWFENFPVCHRCSTPCLRCRSELGIEITSEMPTAQAILSLGDIHTVEEEQLQEDEPVANQPNAKSSSPSPPIKKRLRKRKR